MPAPRILYSPSTAESPNVPTPTDVPRTYQDIPVTTPEKFGGIGVGVALQRAGSDVQQGASQLWDTAKFLQTQKNTTDANNISRAAAQQADKVLYGDGTTQNPGLLSLKGDAFLHAQAGAMQTIQQIYNNARGQLGNPEAQNMFDQQSRYFMTRHQDLLFEHGMQEQITSAKAGNEAAVAQGTNSVGLNYNDDNYARVQIGQITDALTKNWELANNGPGSAPDAIKAQKQRDAFDIITDTRVHAAINAGNMAEANRILQAFGPWGNADKLAPLYRELKPFNDALVAGQVYNTAGGPGAVPGGASGVYNYLISKGATKNEAVLLTSAANNESSFRYTLTHDGGIGYGLFGHNGSRLKQMQQESGSVTPEWQPQLDFALKELRGRPEGAQVNAATTAEQLTDLQMQYEQPNRSINNGNYAGRLAATREYMTHPPVAITASTAPTPNPTAVPNATPEQSGPTSSVFAGKPPIAGGDSIAQQQIVLGNIGGDKGPNHNDPTNTTNAAAIGRPIAGVETYYSNLLKNNPNALKGQTVYLSSGASNTFAKGYNNDPTQLAGIERTIQMINAAGGRVTLMGVGNHFDGSNLNQDLAALAERNHAAFGGHLIGTEKDSTGIHPDAKATRSQLDAATMDYFDIKSQADLSAAIKSGRISDQVAENIIKRRGWTPQVQQP